MVTLCRIYNICKFFLNNIDAIDFTKRKIVVTKNPMRLTQIHPIRVDNCRILSCLGSSTLQIFNK